MHKKKILYFISYKSTRNGIKIKLNFMVEIEMNKLKDKKMLKTHFCKLNTIKRRSD